MKKEVAVIGLGRFGGSICEELSKSGVDVLAMDKNEELVEQYSNIVTQAVVGDSTDENVLRSLGFRNFDHVIVAIGTDIQSSILTTLILKEMGVKKVTAKAINDHHAKVLKKIGADQVVLPERDMGRRLAKTLVSANVLEYLEIADDYSLAELSASRFIHGRTIRELDVRAKYGVNIVAIKRGKEMLVSPQAEEKIFEGDLLIVIGSVQDIERFENKLTNK